VSIPVEIDVIYPNGTSFWKKDEDDRELSTKRRPRNSTPKQRIPHKTQKGEYKHQGHTEKTSLWTYLVRMRNEILAETRTKRQAEEWWLGRIIKQDGATTLIL
jgi:hypothetical protein